MIIIWERMKQIAKNRYISEELRASKRQLSNQEKTISILKQKARKDEQVRENEFKVSCTIF